MSQADDIIKSFGCHLSWTELRPASEKKQVLEREERILAQETWSFTDRPMYYTAIRNLQGFVAFHLEKFDAAFQFFFDVLDKDESNINALGNVAFMYRKSCRIDRFTHYRDKLAVILRQPSYEERARAYADKALAIRNFEQYKRCFRYMKFIERAIAIGRKCHCPERIEWIFDYALGLYRRDVQMLYLRKLAREAPSEPDNSECYSDNRIKEGFLKACCFFLEVARTSTSRDYQALSWVFLGILVNHDPEHRSLSMAFPTDPEVSNVTAEQCYERGLEIHPEYPISNRRVGAEYVKLRRFQEAKQLLDESLRKLPSHFGYRHRALMYLGMYEAANEEERRTEQSREWLLQAIEDFTKALAMHKVHADYSELGYVYFLLEEYDKALYKFVQASESEQDDYYDQVLTHRRWAQCLAMQGDRKGSSVQEDEAKKVRRKILETPLEEEQSDYFSDDFYHYSTRYKPGFVRILQDDHFWTAFSKRRNSELSPHEPWESIPNGRRYRYDFFVWYEDRDSRWTVAFVHKLESEHGRRGSIQRRDFEVGKEVTGEIIRCLKESYKFVIILTPRPPTADFGWGSFAISQAVKENSKRGGDYIVPIKLRDCIVPDVLQTVAARECEEGQVLEDHWVELVQKLTQRPVSLWSKMHLKCQQESKLAKGLV